MKEAERILREIVGKDCIWEEMNNLTNTPIDLVVKAMEMYKNKALTIPVVVGQSGQLKCECKQATFTRTVDEDYNPTCGKCGRTL